MSDCFTLVFMNITEPFAFIQLKSFVMRPTGPGGIIWKHLLNHFGIGHHYHSLKKKQKLPWYHERIFIFTKWRLKYKSDFIQQECCILIHLSGPSLTWYISPYFSVHLLNWMCMSFPSWSTFPRYGRPQGPVGKNSHRIKFYELIYVTFHKKNGSFLTTWYLFLALFRFSI